MQVITILLPKMFSKPCIMVKVFKMGEVACISIGNSKATLLPCGTIPKISQYHSFEFHQNNMIICRYFGIRVGNMWNYTNISFTPNMMVMLPISSTTSSISEGAGVSKKRRDDRTLSDLHFCAEPGYVDSFKDVKAFEMHMISTQHNVPTMVSSMDHMKQYYVNKIKMSKPNALSTVSGQLVSSEKAHLVEYPDQLIIFTRPGWALPVRKNFKFSEKQNKILCKVFKDGEASGKKMGPEQVHLELRKVLSPSEYVEKFYHQVNMFPDNRSVLCSIGNYRCNRHSRSARTETVLF